ncbi:MAG: phosphate ABC transporter ATP-binding protein [Candidatus Omnitrophica bacterium]|nr:phosphate ABC transporter ATP-binding protein [Candidatus Omnitrophota bacterium]
MTQPLQSGHQPAQSGADTAIRTDRLSAWFGPRQALKEITFSIPAQQVTAIIGPSGCGKTTLIRCFNRMHEVIPGARISGRVFISQEDIYGREIDPVFVRRRIGMVFQRPNPFPTMSIYDNVAAGLRLNGLKPGERLEVVVERSLAHAALWNEVKDRLRQPATDLSGGQQQRLCIARALAVEPQIVLFDEPCSALDPVATEKIEELLHRLKERYTIVIVTHNMQQAARVSDDTGFLLLGELVEFGPTDRLFTNPTDPRTEAYITGRFG